MKRIMIDAAQCSGCKNCALACMQAHAAEGENNSYMLNLSNPVNESRNRILKSNNDAYIPLFCRHCDTPECASACMSGALTKDRATGLVTYDESRCAGCFMCVMSCPYGVLKPDSATHSFVIKCDFCKEHDYEPHCVKACVTGAIYTEEVPS